MQFEAQQIGDTWQVEDTLIQRPVVGCEELSESDAREAARRMNSDSVLGGTVVVDSYGISAIKLDQ